MCRQAHRADEGGFGAGATRKSEANVKKNELMPDFPRADIARQLDLAGTLPESADLVWTDGTVTIPRDVSPNRAAYDARYLAAVTTYYGGPRFHLVPIEVDARQLLQTNPIANQTRFSMYKQMLRAGDTVPPLVVEEVGSGLLRVIDGNHRMLAALGTQRYFLPALRLERL